MSIHLTPQQADAVYGFKEWFEGAALPFKQRYSADEIPPVYVQQGFAGTGKSTVLPFFIEACGLDPLYDVTFCAPTGKAAKVMSAKLRDQGIHKQAITIHKAMYRPKGLKFYAIEQKIGEINLKLEAGVGPVERAILMKTLKILKKDLDRAYNESTPSFQLNPEAEAMIKPALIVVDEASMVSEGIADDMLSFGTPILAIGDPGQLQPVGGAPGFFIGEPNHILTEIHRQALDNPIIWASKLIREGDTVPYGSHGDGLLRVLEPVNDDVTMDLDRDHQIIVGTNAKRWQLTRKLRTASGLHAAGPTTNEMMIITKNSRKHTALVNGTIVRVTHDTGELREGGITCRLRGEDEDANTYDLSIIQGILEENYLGKNQWTAPKHTVRHEMEKDTNHQADWAYAITCHKSQGSQWKEVCVHDESNQFRDQARQWLYTAVTRAAEKLTLIIK